jgi:hypothetical protein
VHCGPLGSAIQAVVGYVAKQTGEFKIVRGSVRNRVIFSVAAAMALRVFAAAAFFLPTAGGATYAHHGIASWVDMSRSAAVKGTVTGFDWTNPHSYIYVDAKDERGERKRWTAEMTSVSALSRAGWSRNTVKPGDKITLVGKLAKDGKPRMILDKVVLADGQQLETNDVPTPTIPNGQ